MWKKEKFVVQGGINLFLHLGEDVVVPKSSVIGIFDKTTCFNSISSKEFIEIAKSEKRIRQIGAENKVKTFIITQEGIYLSPISSITLLKRSKDIFELNNEENIEDNR